MSNPNKKPNVAPTKIEMPTNKKNKATTPNALTDCDSDSDDNKSNIPPRTMKKK